jgi:hypothetical protein
MASTHLRVAALGLRTLRRILLRDRFVRSRPSPLVARLPFSMLIVMLSGIAWAEALPPGRYLQSTPPIPMGGGCVQATMNGDTLTGACLNYFQVPQRTTLANARQCASEHGDIWDVNGSLRCVIASVPTAGANPYTADIVSIARGPKSGGEETTVYRIDQPRVDLGVPDRIAAITLRPGDMISITAGGCVQTGGSGNTWKSYTNPLGDNADHLYSGTIAIAGITGAGMQRVGAALAPKEWVVPYDLPFTVPLMLSIGYQDDDYSDNGYYSHDNGDQSQCANVGPAWIELRIVSGARPSQIPQYSPHTAGWDLIWDTNNVDANGLPLNPFWAEQLEPGYWNPDFADCGPIFSFSSWPGNSTTEDVGRLSYCTSQQPTTDLSENYFDLTFGICRPDFNFMFPGHLNWFIVTYTGTIYWQEYSGGWPNDLDLNFGFRPDTLVPNPVGRVLPGVTANELVLGLESKITETAAMFADPWWGEFLQLMLPGSDPTHNIEAAIDGHRAVIIGTMGVDGAHGTGHAEMHPIFAMAIQLSSQWLGDSIEEQWIYFIRNLGNEGGCSHQLHNWPGLNATSYYLPLPWPSPSSLVGSVQFTESQVATDTGTSVSHGTYTGWSYLKFEFPNGAVPESADELTEFLYNDVVSLADGRVTIRYTMLPNLRSDRKSSDAAAPGPAKAKDEPSVDDLLRHFRDPAIAKQFRADLMKDNPETSVARPKRALVAVDPAIKDHRPPDGPGKSGLGVRTRTRVDRAARARDAATRDLAKKYVRYYTP